MPRARDRAALALALALMAVLVAATVYVVFGLGDPGHETNSCPGSAPTIVWVMPSPVRLPALTLWSEHARTR